MRKFIRSGLVKVYVFFEHKRPEAYRAARRQQKTASNKHFYAYDVWADSFTKMVEVSASEWVDAKFEGTETSVSNSSIKGKIKRTIPRSHWTRSGRREWLDVEPIMKRAQRLNKLQSRKSLLDSCEVIEIMGIVE